VNDQAKIVAHWQCGEASGPQRRKIFKPSTEPLERGGGQCSHGGWFLDSLGSRDNSELHTVSVSNAVEVAVHGR
jgi:hypothetical protein